MSTSQLRNIINNAAEEHDMTLKDLTVLSSSRDPYRLDTPKNHVIGQWLQTAYNELHDGGRIHLRGLHYKLVGRVTKPDGQPYINTDENWVWFSEKAAKAARYLGYIPWDAIRDARNSPPQIFTPEHSDPRWYLKAGEVDCYLPDTLEPSYSLRGDLHRQPWRQIVIAEKQGVEELLLPVCQRRQATLCLPGGEISDTLVYDLLSGYDERPIAIHQLGDFDPAGHQMAISTARKVQALVDTRFSGMRVVVHAPSLTLDQCSDWGLPSTPLKETEKRAANWESQMGWEQTELDAAVALAPDEFVDVVENSLLQYYDKSLGNRSAQLKRDLEEEANERLAEQLGEAELERIREQATDKMADLEELVDEVNDALFVSSLDIGIEEPETPDVLIGESDMGPNESQKGSRLAEYPLIDTAYDYASQSINLINRKNYF